MVNSQNTHEQNNASQYNGADEISLIDLWLVLVKRKRLIGIVILVSIILGMSYAFIKQPQYKFYATLEVGSKILEGKLQFIEEPKSLQPKIEGSYIPQVLSRYMSEGNDKELELTAVIPKESQVIEISGKGVLADQELYTSLIKEVLELVKKDHAYFLKVLREEETIKRNLLLNRKEEFNDKSKLLDNKLKRIQQAEQLLKNQITETKSLIESGLKNRDKAIKQAKDEAHAMTVMMIENGLQVNRRLLAELEQKLYIDLENEKDSLAKQLADLQRDTKNTDLEIEKLLLQEGAYRNTREILEPVRSRYPVGHGKKLIIMLSAVLGIFIAIFAAFFAEFMAKVKERTAAEAE